MASLFRLLRVAGQSIAFVLLFVAGNPCLPANARDPSSTLPLFVLGPPSRADGNGVNDLSLQPEQWQATRAATNQILCADHVLAKYNDDDLRKFFAQLQTWNIKLELEVGAIKEWGPTGTAAFQRDKVMWDRLQSLGGTISSLAMDEPLSCVRRMIKKPDDFAAEETATFIGLVQQNYPSFKIVEIEPYPSISVADHRTWIDSLQQRLAKRNLKPLNAYRLDVDWVGFELRENGNWKVVKQIEDYCHQVDLPFSLIYWSSDYPFWKHRQMADDATWYTGVASQGYAYAAVGGRPDQFVIESWVGAPAAIVPENGDFTFTRSALDFYRKFIQLPATPAP